MKAYPPEEKPKKTKKAKDKGSRHPGAAAAQAPENKADGEQEKHEKPLNEEEALAKLDLSRQPPPANLGED